MSGLHPEAFDGYPSMAAQVCQQVTADGGGTEASVLEQAPTSFRAARATLVRELMEEEKS